jgi:predicted ester cyclase
MDVSSKKYRLHDLQNRHQLHLRLTGFVCLVLTLGIAFALSWTSPAIAVSSFPKQEAALVSLKNQGDPVMSVEQNRAIALRFAKEGWGTNPNWRKIWDELMTADVVYHFNSSAEPVVGLQANKAFNADLFQGFPDLHQTIEDVIAEGDKVVYRTTLQGTNTGAFLGTAPTGKSVKINDFTLLKVSDDGKIAEWWYECNLLEVMQQLGLVPEAS